MKQPFSIVFITIMLLQIFGRVYDFIDFKINQDYIAKNFCENRDKPAMHCNGKCYLIKKIKAAQEEEQRQELQFQKDNFHLINQSFSIQIVSAAFWVYSIDYQKVVPTIPHSKSISLACDIFQPPCFL